MPPKLSRPKPTNIAHHCCVVILAAHARKNPARLPTVLGRHWHWVQSFNCRATVEKRVGGADGRLHSFKSLSSSSSSSRRSRVWCTTNGVTERWQVKEGFFYPRDIIDRFLLRFRQYVFFSAEQRFLVVRTGQNSSELRLSGESWIASRGSSTTARGSR